MFFFAFGDGAELSMYSAHDAAARCPLPILKYVEAGIGSDYTQKTFSALICRFNFGQTAQIKYKIDSLDYGLSIVSGENYSITISFLLDRCVLQYTLLKEGEVGMGKGIENGVTRSGNGYLWPNERVGTV